MIYYQVDGKLHAFQNREQAQRVFSGIYKKYLKNEVK